MHNLTFQFPGAHIHYTRIIHTYIHASYVYIVFISTCLLFAAYGSSMPLPNAHGGGGNCATAATFPRPRAGNIIRYGRTHARRTYTLYVCIYIYVYIHTHIIFIYCFHNHVPLIRRPVGPSMPQPNAHGGGENCATTATFPRPRTGKIIRYGGTNAKRTYTLRMHTYL